MKLILIVLAPLCLLMTGLFHPGRALAHSTPNVPIDDPVYRDIDKLVAAGLVKDVIYGQRPWSRGEIARILSVAIQNREKIPLMIPADNSKSALWPHIDNLLEKMKGRFREELVDRGVIEGKRKFVSLHPLSYVEAQYTFLDSESRAIPDNGFGPVAADVEPLTEYDEGRRYPDGHQFSIESEHLLKVSRFFSFYARPRFQMEITHDGDGSIKPFIQQLYGKLTVPHFEIEAGRDSIEWGQGEFGGILLSNNARPFDMIKVSNPSPTILPSIFKYIGPLRYTFFVANLGPEREFPYSFLTGLKLSVKPFSFFEVGFGQTLVLGGDGAPGPLNLGNVLREFFASTFTSRPGDISQINLANRETGFDFRFFIPFLRNAQVYLDVQFEDDSKERLFMLTDLANYHAGIYVPLLDKAGKTSLRLEYRHGSPSFYRHGIFTTGMAMNGRLWGDALGPQADGASASLSYDYSSNLRFSSSLQYERRDGDLVTEAKDPDGKNRRVVVTVPRPEEIRVILKTEGSYRFDQRMSMTWELGYERINSFNFLLGDDRNGFLGRTALRLHFL